MKKTLITSLLTFCITSAVIASTGFHSYATTDEGKRIQLNEDGTYSYLTDQSQDNPYIGTYYISDETINFYIVSYLESRNIDKNSSSWDFSYNIMQNLFKNDPTQVEKVIGEFTYSITSDKLIIRDELEKQTVSWDYEIKDNILYAKVYGGDKMAIGKFKSDGKYLEVANAEMGNNHKVLLQKSLLKY